MSKIQDSELRDAEKAPKTQERTDKKNYGWFIVSEIVFGVAFCVAIYFYYFR